MAIAIMVGGGAVVTGVAAGVTTTTSANPLLGVVVGGAFTMATSLLTVWLTRRINHEEQAERARKAQQTQETGSVADGGLHDNGHDGTSG